MTVNLLTPWLVYKTMTKKFLSRIETLESQTRENDHDWDIEISLNENGRVIAKHYKDGQEITRAQFMREYRPKPGEQNQIIVDWTAQDAG